MIVEPITYCSVCARKLGRSKKFGPKVKRRGRGLPSESKKGLYIEAEQIFQDVGEVKLAVQVNVLITHGRANSDGIGHRPALGRWGLE